MADVAPPWSCDTCGQPINSIEDGWVEWISRRDGEKTRCHSLRVVHAHSASPRANRCQHDEDHWFKDRESIVSDLPLEEFLGADGLMHCLQFLSDHDFVDDEEVIELIKRLQISGYEQARKHFDEAIARGEFEPNTKPGFYRQSDIKATLRFTNTEKERRQ